MRLGGVRTALFAQHHVQQLKLEVTPVDHLRMLFEDMSVQDCRNYLGTFGIRGMTATTQVCNEFIATLDLPSSQVMSVLGFRLATSVEDSDLD